jgi:hypothetical protein
VLSASDIRESATWSPLLGARFSKALYLPSETQPGDRAFLRGVASAVEEEGVECHWETFVEEDTVPDAARLTLWLEG